MGYLISIFGYFSSNYELNTKSIKYFEIILIYIYLTIYGSLDFVANFFENYSDKYELHKGSDLNFNIYNFLLYL